MFETKKIATTIIANRIYIIIILSLRIVVINNRVLVDIYIVVVDK